MSLVVLSLARGVHVAETSDMDEETWQNVMKRMMHQLQALAMPAEIQLGLLPDFVCKGDDLADSYAHWCLCLLSNDYGRLTEQQRLALTCLLYTSPSPRDS